MELIDVVKTYTFCVYLFFTIIFWLFAFLFSVKKFKENEYLSSLLFFIFAIIITPFVWPFIGASAFIKRMAGC